MKMDRSLHRDKQWSLSHLSSALTPGESASLRRANTATDTAYRLAARPGGSARGHVLHWWLARPVARYDGRHGHADGGLLDGALEPPLQEALQPPPAGRDEAEEADEVGQHAGRDEHRRREKDQHTVNDRFGGQLTGVEIGAQARQRTDALLSGQRRADDSGAYDEADRDEGADTLSDLDEQDELDDRYRNEEDEEASHGDAFLAQTASQSVQQRPIESGEYCRINNGIYEQCQTITVYFTIIYNIIGGGETDRD